MRQSIWLPILFSLSCFAILIAGGLYIRDQLMQSYLTLDEKQINDDAWRMAKSLDEFVTYIEDKTKDWATWDSSYQYIQKGSSHFEEKELSPASLATVRVSGIIILDKNLHVLAAKQFDEETNTTRNIPSAQLNFIDRNSLLIRNSEHELTSAFINFGNQIILASATKSVRSDGGGPPTGRVILFQKLGPSFLRTLADRTLHRVTLIKSDAITQRPGIQRRILRGPYFINVYRNRAVTHLALNDFEGKALAYLAFETSRDTMTHGVRYISTSGWIYSLMALIISFGCGAFIRNQQFRIKLERTEAERQHSQKQASYLQALLDSIPGFVVWFDEELRYEGVNKRLADMFHMTREQFVGQKLGFMKIENGLYFRSLVEDFYASNDSEKRQEMFFEVQNQRRKYMVLLQKYDNNTHVLAVLLDITDFWHLQLDVERSRQIAIHASRLPALGVMAAGIAHEIKNPLMIIQGAMWSLERSYNGETPEKQRKLFETVDKTIMRISQIIGLLLTFSRDGYADPFVQAPITDIMNAVQALCRERIQNRGIACTINTVPAHTTIRCRPVQIEQVLMSLLNNSYDAVVNTENPWIKVECTDTPHYVEWRISDSGKGIDADVVKRMWDPFFTTKSIGKGTGLGLGIAQSIIKDHQGDIFYDETSPNTCFVVRLPREIATVP